MAESLTGGPVSAPMDGGFLCLYAADSVRTQVTLSVTSASNSDAEGFIKDHGGAKEGDKYESVPGLPGKNLLVVTSYQTHGLTVFNRGKEVNLIVHRGMTPELRNAMIETMKRILGKIRY